MSDEKPQILFERAGHPYGGHPHPLVRGKRIDALYKFKIKNAGHQAAVLGDNPFRAIDYKEVYRRTLKKKRMPRIMVAIPEGQVVPNVLEPGMSFNLDIALGHFGKKTMSDPFSFRVYYTNVKGHRYRTTVKMRPQSGDVVSLRQMRLGLISGLFM